MTLWEDEKECRNIKSENERWTERTKRNMRWKLQKEGEKVVKTSEWREMREDG